MDVDLHLVFRVPNCSYGLRTRLRPGMVKASQWVGGVRL